jgi:isoquinoline 1-oxidoreductase beta subunit
MAGGGFGRRAVPTATMWWRPAPWPRLAMAAGLNDPMRVLWSREDDIKGGYYRPMHVHRAEIGFDAKGKVLAWDHVVVGQSIAQGTPFEAFMIKDGIDNTALEGMREPYDVPMRLSVHHPKVNVPVLVVAQRGLHPYRLRHGNPGRRNSPCHTARPVAYRMQLWATNTRATKRTDVGGGTIRLRQTQAAQGPAWGVAVHESFDTVVAYVAEASVTKGGPSCMPSRRACTATWRSTPEPWKPRCRARR